MVVQTKGVSNESIAGAVGGVAGEPRIFGLIERAGLAYRGNGPRPALTVPGSVREDILVTEVGLDSLPPEVRATYAGFEETVAVIHVEHEIRSPVYAVTLKTGTRERWTSHPVIGWKLVRSIR